MRYFKQYKEKGAEPQEITKEEARRLLDGWWNEESLDEMFSKGKAFRLFTPYCEVWTQNERGMVPMAGFYGIVG